MTTDMSATSESKILRAVIYTRKSTEGTHDAQMTSCESQRQACEQWAAEKKKFLVLPTRYDDFGYSGGNTDRPAYQKLLTDIHAGGIDAVIVYDIDRLTRSTIDFPIIRELLREKGIQTLSVTENYDGMAEHYKNFMLGIKMNMAEFQRMDASARVKQKLYLMAEKGMRVGGSPVLGYDIVNKTWVVNKAEAKQAVELFQTYRKTQSLSATTRAMNARGSVTKPWTTAKGVVKGGKAYSKSTVHYLLRHPVYVGMIRYGGKVSKGQHQGIIAPELFAEVQKILASNGEGHDSLHRGKAELWLKGKLHCACCGSAMTPTWSVSKGKMYPYYECTKSRSLGKELCPVRRVPAEEIHKAILDRLSFLGRHAPLIKNCLDEAAKIAARAGTTFETELKRVDRELFQVEKKGQNLAEAIAQGAWARDNAFVQKKLEEVTDKRMELTAIKTKLEHDDASRSTPLPRFSDVQTTLRQFPEAMVSLKPESRKALADLLIDEVIYDEARGTMTTTIFPLPKLPGASLPAGFRKASKTSERVGFEPTDAVTRRQFSRLVP